MSSKNVYIFAGGGSGGHLYPGIATAQVLTRLQPDARIIFLCTTREIDKNILTPAINNTNWRYIPQPVLPLPTRPWQIGKVRQFVAAWRQSIALCRKLMQQHRPAAVLGLGGFASGPALKTAHKLHIPTAMLNPDCVPGKANKYCKKYADKIFVQWADTLPYFGKAKNKCIVTGCPVRQGFNTISQHHANNVSLFNSISGLNLDPHRKILLIFGGSQGGHNINTSVIQLFTNIVSGNNISDNVLKRLKNGWQIVHITGSKDKQWVRQQYKHISLQAHVIDFTGDMDKLLCITDLAISRAGASTLAELTISHSPAILLPYPYHRDRHQRLNAAVLEKAHAARIVKDYCDADKTAACLYNVLKKCLEPDELKKMAASAAALAKPDAAQTLANSLAS